MVAIGGAFFLTSDSLLAWRLFLPDAAPGWFGPAVMATYTLGQGLIVAGVLRQTKRRESVFLGAG
ncbi:lysoplasmalogenase family protein, partial [Gordonia sp. (in: high G+C Gram-positive bacteria)]